LGIERATPALFEGMIEQKSVMHMIFIVLKSTAMHSHIDPEIRVSTLLSTDPLLDMGGEHRDNTMVQAMILHTHLQVIVPSHFSDRENSTVRELEEFRISIL
jgi:hypothetical protein